MSRQETKNHPQPIFQTPEGWRFKIAGRTMDVHIDPERMRQDFLAEGRARGFEEETLQSLAASFSFGVADRPPWDTRIGITTSSTEIDLLVPLDRSYFRVDFYRLGILLASGFLGSPGERNENIGLLRTQRRPQRMDHLTPTEALVMNVGRILSESWWHEREHLLQVFTMPRTKEREWERKSLRHRTSINIDGFSLKAGLALAPSLVENLLHGSVHPLNPAISLAISFLVVNLLERRLRFLDYRSNPLEIAAHERMLGGENLSRIFDVRVVNEG